MDYAYILYNLKFNDSYKKELVNAFTFIYNFNINFVNEISGERQC